MSGCLGRGGGGRGRMLGYLRPRELGAGGRSGRRGGDGLGWRRWNSEPGWIRIGCRVGGRTLGAAVCWR